VSYKRYFSYIRVSTVRQGQHGTSLAEQKAAIERFSRQWNLTVVKQFEERETAARQGRPVFLQMLKELRGGKADGVIIHKIDRGARNLKDWADLGALIDSGLEVHFANETLDLSSRGGRLSADIQAVVASDYIRNLREETKKGIYGRLKQGLYPFPARVGYLDAGKGNPKRLDPEQAPLVREAFELYASGRYGLNALVERMYERGLRNKNGGKVTRNGLATLLHNPFYTGLIRVETMEELFAGQHPPIVTRKLFDEVQAVFAGKANKKQVKHFFIFRRHIRCGSCRNTLIPERQKGYIYYRCQTKSCAQKTLREELVENKLLETLEKLRFDERENELFWTEIVKYDRERAMTVAATHKQLLLHLEAVKLRRAKLADAYVDEVFDKETYLERKNSLIAEEHLIKEKLTNPATADGKALRRVEKFLELLNQAYTSYKLGNPAEKRELVKITTSNFTAQGKSVSIKLEMPFQIVAERERFPVGSPHRAATRTYLAQIRELSKKLYEFFFGA
jgi:site-specific DNA recombinase